MTVKALKKKNNMSGPFKMKGSPMARNFGIGASPVRNREDTLQESGGPPKSGDGRPKAKNADTVNAKPRKTEKKSNVAVGTEKVSKNSPGSGWTKTKGTNIWTYNG
tara:strand:+ start:1142 stop:1459 length:318 start_codon:yes stop_codon:yes gene_type:complete